MSRSTRAGSAKIAGGVAVRVAGQTRMPLWSQWAIAAVEQRDLAEQARTDLTSAWVQNGDWASASRREMRAAMQCIVAAAFALEGWGFAHSSQRPRRKSGLGASGVKRIMNRTYLTQANERTQRRLLRERVGRLFELRNDIAHHKAELGHSAMHPVLGSTPRESGTYTVEAAREACATLKGIAELSLVHASPRHTPPQDVAGHAQIVLDAFT